MPEPTAQASAARGAILSVRGLSRSFGGLQAVRDVDLDLPTGAVFALIGPNGAGKSTIVNLLAGVLVPTSGRIVMDGAELTGRSSHVVARSGLVRTFQNGRLFARLTVLENVLVGADGRYRASLLDAILRTSRFRTEDLRIRERARALLAELGLAADADRMVRELPYGKQRKVEIARALMSRPKVLLLDEPSLGLAPLLAEEVYARLSEISATGVTILLVEQNTIMALSIATRAYVIEHGAVVLTGRADELLDHPRVREAYLGA